MSWCQPTKPRSSTCSRQGRRRLQDEIFIDTTVYHKLAHQTLPSGLVTPLHQMIRPLLSWSPHPSPPPAKRKRRIGDPTTSPANADADDMLEDSECLVDGMTCQLFVPLLDELSLKGDSKLQRIRLRPRMEQVQRRSA
jgi:hypothetical protein